MPCDIHYPSVQHSAAQHGTHTHTWGAVYSTAHAYPSLAEQSTDQSKKTRVGTGTHTPLEATITHLLWDCIRFSPTVQPKPMLPQNSSQTTRVHCQPASQQPLSPPPYCTPLSHPHQHHQHHLPTPLLLVTVCVCDTTLGSTGLPKRGSCCMQPHDRDPSTASRQAHSMQAACLKQAAGRHTRPTTHTHTLVPPHSSTNLPASKAEPACKPTALGVQEMSAVLCAGPSTLTQSTGEPRQDRHTASQL